MVKTSEMSMELKQELAFTKEELAELEAAKKMPITFDADCPETTPERAVKFRRVNPPRNRILQGNSRHDRIHAIRDKVRFSSISFLKIVLHSFAQNNDLVRIFRSIFFALVDKLRTKS